MFAGASLPFQLSGSENDFGEEIKETVAYNNNLDVDEADISDKTIAFSSCNLNENIPSDSVLLFGSGRKIHSGLDNTGFDDTSEPDDCSTMMDFGKKGPGQDKSLKDFTRFKSEANSTGQNQNKIKDIRTIPISTSENAVYVYDFPKGSFPVDAVRNDSTTGRNLDGHQKIMLQTNDLTTKTQNRLENNSEGIISMYDVPKVSHMEWQTKSGEDNKRLTGKFDEPSRREVALRSSDVSVVLSKNIGGTIQETIQTTPKLQPDITTCQEGVTGITTTSATNHLPATHPVANLEPKEKQPEFPAVYPYYYGQPYTTQFPLVNMPFYGYEVPHIAPNQQPYYMPYLVHPSYIYPVANPMYSARPATQYGPSGHRLYGPRFQVLPPPQVVQMTNAENQEQNSQSQFTHDEYLLPVSVKEDCTEDKERPKEISNICFESDDDPYSTPYKIYSVQHG